MRGLRLVLEQGHTHQHIGDAEQKTERVLQWVEGVGYFQRGHGKGAPCHGGYRVLAASAGPVRTAARRSGISFYYEGR